MGVRCLSGVYDLSNPHQRTMDMGEGATLKGPEENTEMVWLNIILGSCMTLRFFHC